MQFYPAIISNHTQAAQSITPLTHISLENPGYNEKWLQDLIHIHPHLVPASEIEACFDPIIPVMREFPLQGKLLDNFFITPDGYPVLVEVKLWKNPESRRKVIVQLLEYASMFAELNYEDINHTIRAYNKNTIFSDNPLHDIVSAYVANPPDEVSFVNRLARNLREGRFLLLVLGDGIREELSTLSRYFTQHHLRYSFGMVEIRLFQMPDGQMLALPRVLAKTQSIERHVTVVTIEGNGYARTTSAPVVHEHTERGSLSVNAFYELLHKEHPEHLAFAKALVTALSDDHIDLQPGMRSESLMLKYTLQDGSMLHLMKLTTTSGEFWGVPNKHWQDPAWKELSRKYLQRLIYLLPGTYAKEYGSGMDIKLNDKAVPLALLYGKAEAIAHNMRQVIRDAETYISAQEAL